MFDIWLDPRFWIVVAVDLILAGAVVFLLRTVRRFRRQRNALLREKDVIFNFIYDVGELFVDSETVDSTALLKRVLSYALRTTRGGAGAAYLVDPDDETLHAVAVSGVFPPLTGEVDAGLAGAFSKVRYIERLVRTQTIKTGVGLVGEVHSRNQAILIERAEGDPRIPTFNLDILTIHSILLVPMRFQRRVIGVIAVINPIDGGAFNRSDLDLLQALADHASVSIHYVKVGAALDEKTKMDADLSVAKQIQNTLLPKDIPQLPNVDLSAFSVAARHVGGDYYDFVRVDDEHLGIAIADVSGKSIAGAIFMSICRSVLRVQAPGQRSPGAVLRAMNRILSQDLANDMFISILYMVLNTRTHELALARGGHPQPLLWRAGANSDPAPIGGRGMAMGLTEPESFEQILGETRVQLAPGDLLVAYTDGLVEAKNSRDEEWGVPNLSVTVSAAAQAGESARAVALDIQEKVLQFVGQMSQYDDMTLVVIRIP